MGVVAPPPITDHPNRTTTTTGEPATMSDTTTTPAAASAATTWPVLVEIPDFVGPTPATTDGRLWNGWQTPRFDFDAACSVALALVGRGVPAAYDPDRDLFVTLEQTDLSFDDLADNGDDDVRRLQAGSGPTVARHA